jgi:hypothetical protein
MKPLRLAVDTNVLLDLADGVEAVVDTFALLGQRLPGNDTLVVPSVLDELAFYWTNWPSLASPGKTSRSAAPHSER